MLIDNFTNFIGGNIFALPAEGIADAVNKLIVPLSKSEPNINNFHQVAGIEVGIPLSENVPYHFFRRRIFVCVAFEF